MKGSVFVNCWKCGKKFDITSAKHCTEHLKGGAWTTKCSHCGACICHKFNKMKKLCRESKYNNNKLRLSGIECVMPSVHKKLCPQTIPTVSEKCEDQE